uniref:Uncharacterized protein n=1 Tax=Anguilla anguilla TaxID=7936 RepID=A0A0E9RHY1_ANGAN
MLISIYISKLARFPKFPTYYPTLQSIVTLL